MDDVQICLAAARARFAPIIIAEARASAMMPPVLMPMHLAVDGHPFQIESTDGCFFLKLMAPEMLAFVAWDATVLASRRAGERGIAPPLLAEDAALGAMLFAWKGAPAGRMPLRGDFADPAVLAATLAAKKAWHESPRLGCGAGPFARLRRYRAALESMDHAIPLPASLPLLFGWAERIEAAILASGTDPVPLHGENTISNLLLQADGSVLLVDFDYAADGDRFYDLAAFSLELCSFEDEVESLLEAYLGRADVHAFARMQAYRVIDDLVWGCWALLAQARSPRAGKIEFYKYAQNRLLRCRYWLGIREFDSVLRQV